MGIPQPPWQPAPESGQMPGTKFATCPHILLLCTPGRTRPLVLLALGLSVHGSAHFVLLHQHLCLTYECVVIAFTELHRVPINPFPQLTVTIGQLLFLYCDKSAIILQKHRNAR